MSRWVVDTSPLIFLAKLSRLDLLRKSADEVLVPAAVIEEVRAYPDEASRKIEDALAPGYGKRRSRSAGLSTSSWPIWISARRR
jgi:hypothetical protein